MIKSYFYKSHKLNKEKYQNLYDYAVKVREHKNLVSQAIYNYYLEDIYKGSLKSKQCVTMLKHLRNSNEIASTTMQQLIEEVYSKYKTNIDKKFINHKFDMSSNLSITISHMIRYFKDKNSYIKFLSKKKDQFYKDILNHINKFGDKLLQLVLKKQKQLLRSLKCIEFISLTYQDINMLSKNNMIESSNLKLSNAVVNINIFKELKVTLPTRHCNKYHGILQDYKCSENKITKQKQYTYKIKFDEIKKQVSILLIKEVEEDIENDNLNNIYGVDVNTKHNLFTISNSVEIDYDRNLITKIVKAKRKLQQIQTINTSRNITHYSKRMIKIQDKINKRIKSHLEYKCFELLNQYQNSHLVLEDLERNLKKSYISNQEFDGIKYNDLFSLLRLYDIKNVVKRMSKNYGVTVSLTNPEYTSQQCNHCGYISKENRKTQEEFKCIKCEHKDGADINASKNIRDRINVNVLRNTLHILEVGKSNTYLPKFKNRFKLKEELFGIFTSGFNLVK